jgi:Tfp pilus assembly protein PilX
MLIGAIRIETVLVVLVVLNLIGLSIAAYLVMRRK